MRRDPSGDSVSVSSRRLSNETGTTTPQPTSEKSDVFADNMTTKNPNSFKNNLSPEFVAQISRQIAQSPTKKASESSENLVPNPNPDKITDEVEPKAKMKPSFPTDKKAIQGDQHTSDGIGDGLKSPLPITATPSKEKGPATEEKAPVSETKAPADEAKEAKEEKAPAKEARAATGGAKAPTSKPAPKSAPITTTTTKAIPKAKKSPTTTATKSHAKEPAKATTPAPEKKAATTTSGASKDQAAAKKTTAPKSTATAAKKAAPANLSPGTTAARPKSKSPTRPITLPPSLTTHTTASASKLGNGAAAAAPGRQSHSRASGNGQNHAAHPASSHRPASRASGSTAGTAPAIKALKRQNSNGTRPRPSLGPPPKQVAKDHPVTKRDNHVDEGFLARMMRPTASSQSKTADKAPVTPPRKHNPPSTTQPKRTLPTKDVEGSAKKAAAKIQSSGKPKAVTRTPKATTEQPKTTAKEVAPVVAQTETAEEAIETAKESKDTATTPIVEETEEVAIEPTAEAVAPVAAQTETADAAIEEAKVSTDTAATPVVEKTEAEAKAEAEADTEAKVEAEADAKAKAEAEAEVAVESADDSKSASPVPTLTVEPEKVEDIEDLVHEPAHDEPSSSEEKAAEPEPEPESAEAVAEKPTAATDDVKEDEVTAAAEKLAEEEVEGSNKTE